MRFFQKIGKIAILSIKLTANLTIWVENSKKLDFSVKRRIFKIFVSTNNFMWSNISAKAKQLFYHTKKNRGGNISQIKSYTYNHNYCRKHRKFAKLIILHNRTQKVRKSHLLLCKISISQVPRQLFYKQV